MRQQFGSERVRERESEWEVKQHKEWAECDINIKLLATNCISSLQVTFSDELSFIIDNDTDSYDFLFSDDLFSSLFVTFSDEMGFVTNNVLSNTFSDEIFCGKKLKLLAMK